MFMDSLFEVCQGFLCVYYTQQAVFNISNTVVEGSYGDVDLKVKRERD